MGRVTCLNFSVCRPAKESGLQMFLGFVWMPPDVLYLARMNFSCVHQKLRDPPSPLQAVPVWCLRRFDAHTASVTLRPL